MGEVPSYVVKTPLRLESVPIRMPDVGYELGTVFPPEPFE
jgi:hypothetical protein